MEDGIFFNQSKYIKEMLKKFRLENSKPTKLPMSTEIKLTKDDEADSVDSSKYRGAKMPSEYQQDYKKTRAYALKIYNDPNMPDALRDIYRNLESRYVHEGRTIDPSFYNDLSDDSLAKFTAIDFDCLLTLDEQIFPRFIYESYKTLTLEKRLHQPTFIEKTLEQIEPYNSRLPAINDIRNLIHRRTVHEKNLKENMAQGSFNECYKLVPRKMSSLKAKQPKKPLPKRTRNVGKSKRTQLSTSSSTESPPSDNDDLPSTKLSPRSYSRALKDDPNMSKEQRETRGVFKNLGRALHNFARLLKKGCH
ncbi:hypothetical protein Tco_0004646 [Tanacetum coccineum]